MVSPRPICISLGVSTTTDPPSCFIAISNDTRVRVDGFSNIIASARSAERALAMIFEKPSTRTRVSFEIAMKQLGGSVVVLTPNEMQIGRGETIADTARVLSRYVDAIMMRTTENDKLASLSFSVVRIIIAST